MPSEAASKSTGGASMASSVVSFLPAIPKRVASGPWDAALEAGEQAQAPELRCGGVHGGMRAVQLLALIVSPLASL